MWKYKPATAAALAQRVLEPGDAVLEVGAADGTFTEVYAQRVGPTGAVLAIEPHRRSRHALQRRTAPYPWVAVLGTAVGASTGMVQFFHDRRTPQRSSLYPDNIHAGDRALQYELVRMTTIDELVARMPQTPALIVLDAQGAEAAILRGGTRTLRLPIVWIMEVWPAGLERAGASIASVLQPFAAGSYQVTSTHGDVLTWDRVPQRCREAGRRKSGHIDLVMVPPAIALRATA